jgi:ubiquinone/menaquinone biosynthesis C-methylase UbiE
VVDAAEFDQFADEYTEMHRANIAITGEAPEYFAEYKIRLLKDFAAGATIAPDRVLDFGSGIGNSMPYFARYFPASRLTCADLSQRSLAVGDARFPGLGQTALIEANAIPSADDAFDVAFSACVFHHIPHEEHVHWLRELRRVTRGGGMLSVFEHNPLNPLTVRAVNTCPFDANARLLRARLLAERFRLGGWRDIEVRYHLFFPRKLAALRSLEPHLTKLPVGAQYSVSARK